MSQYVESEKIELKAKFTNTICRELVAFLNADGGQIIIGVDDNGNVIGVDKIDETLKKISDVITMQIEPNPQEEIRTELKFDSGNTLIVLSHQPPVQLVVWCEPSKGLFLLLAQKGGVASIITGPL